MLSQNMQETMKRADDAARTRKQEFVTLEHLLFALTEDPEARASMQFCKVDVDKLRRDLSEFLDKGLAAMTLDYAPEQSKYVKGVQRTMQRANDHLELSRTQVVTGAHVFLALLSEDESHALNYLRQYAVNRQDAVLFLKNGPTFARTVVPREAYSGAAKETAYWEKLVPVLQAFRDLGPDDQDFVLSSDAGNERRAAQLRATLVKVAKNTGCLSAS